MLVDFINDLNTKYVSIKFEFKYSKEIIVFKYVVTQIKEWLPPNYTLHKANRSAKVTSTQS